MKNVGVLVRPMPSASSASSWTRDRSPSRASELRYARIPALKSQLEQAERSLIEKQEDGAILKEAKEVVEGAPKGVLVGARVLASL